MNDSFSLGPSPSSSAENGIRCMARQEKGVLYRKIKSQLSESEGRWASLDPLCLWKRGGDCCQAKEGLSLWSLPLLP